MSLFEPILLDNIEKAQALEGFPCYLWNLQGKEKDFPFFRNGNLAFGCYGFGRFSILEYLVHPSYEFAASISVLNPRGEKVLERLIFHKQKEGFGTDESLAWVRIYYQWTQIKPYLTTLNRIRALSCGQKPLDLNTSGYETNDIISDLCHYYKSSSKARVEIEHSKLHLPLKFYDSLS